MLVAAPVPPAVAAEPEFPSLRAALPKHAGWILLAGLGLIAVAVGAFAVRRGGEPIADEPPLGVLREEAPAPPTTPVESVAVVDPSVAIPDAEGDAPTIPPERPRETAAPPAPGPDGSHLFLALQHVDLSIDVLRRHLERELRPMPAVWLMLLDLCRTHGREQTFAEIALEFHRRFNVCMAAWDRFPPSRDDPGLEAYPRLVKLITQSWGTHEGRRLLDRLLYDNRNGNRRGFTLNAYNDLIALRRAADAVLTSIEADLAEEAKVRSAFAVANAEVDDLPKPPAAADSPLVRELESNLEDDLRAGVAPQSALEREQPALVGMLAREWGNAALAARLCEMLARGGDGTHPLSKEAAEELELLRHMAERLCEANGVTLASAG